MAVIVAVHDSGGRSVVVVVVSNGDNFIFSVLWKHSLPVGEVGMKMGQFSFL